jgi:hypothetical protein
LKEFVIPAKAGIQRRASARHMNQAIKKQPVFKRFLTHMLAIARAGGFSKG